MADREGEVVYTNERRASRPVTCPCTLTCGLWRVLAECARHCADRRPHQGLREEAPLHWRVIVQFEVPG